MTDKKTESELNAEQQTWVREHFQGANAYLAERGMLSQRILTKESRYLVPHLAVWKFELTGNEKVWVINGEVPTNHMPAEGVPTAREAARSFCLSWQLQAEKILRSDMAKDETQKKYANYLIECSEALYPVVAKDELWGGQ